MLPSIETSEPFARSIDAHHRLAATLRDVAESQDVVGMTIAIVRASEPTLTFSIGSADMAAGRAVTIDTAFPWFSMTKIVTATAVMQLVEDGIIALDHPAADYLPALGRTRSRSGTPITIRHLLSHAAGLANPIPVRWVHPADESGPDTSVFVDQQLRRHRRLRSNPGGRGRYTNLGYLALGEIVAAVAGVPFTDHVRQRILEPLGMSATYFDEPRATETTVYQRARLGLTPVLRLALPAGIVQGKVGRWVAYRPFRVDGPAYGGLVGSAGDAATFLRAHLPADPARPALLQPATVAEMQAITTPGKPYDHGLGWFRQPQDRRRGPRFVEHLGGGLGVYNTMRVYPEHGVGVVVMSNTPGYDREAVLAPIVHSML